MVETSPLSGLPTYEKLTKLHGGQYLCEDTDESSSKLRQLQSSRKQGYGRLSLAFLVLFGFALLRLEIYTILRSFSPGPSLQAHTSEVVFQNAIEWTSCGDNLECGHLEVPLDYTNSTPGTASLAVIRFLAKDKSTRLGTILTNPGGPGGSGVNYVRRVGQSLSTLTGGGYDIVGWDPRGIGATTPSTKCFDTQAEEDIFLINTHEEYPPSGAWNFSDPTDVAVFESHYRIAQARFTVLADLCLAKSGDNMPFIGTATVVKDIDRLFRAIEGDDEPINFWGFSYGSMLALYLVNMFPDRVGKVIADGTLNPMQWANTHPHEFISDIYGVSEKVLDNFYEGCAEAGPERCALASNSSTAASLATQIDNLLSGLTQRPLAVTNTARPGILTAGVVQQYIFQKLYAPRTWPQLASFLASALKRNGAPILEATLGKVELNATVPADSRFAGYPVICFDGPDYKDADDEDITRDALDALIELGKNFAPHFAALNVDYCHRWSKSAKRPKDRFTGPFNHSLSNTILVIGNTADPVTPINNAHLVHGFLSNSSRLVIQDGSGHCSVALASLCTARIIQDYFNKGVLPANGIVCHVDEELFPPSEDIAFKNMNDLYFFADTELLEAVKQLGDFIAPLRL